MGTKNKLADLNNHLFAALERLNDEDLTEEQLKIEIEKAKAVKDISKVIIDSGKLQLDAMKLMDHAGHDISKASNNILQIEETK